jgi:hypothetical protein
LPGLKYFYSKSELAAGWKSKTSEVIMPYAPNLIAMGVLSIWNAMRSLVFAGNGPEVSVGDVMRESSSHNALELGVIGVAEIGLMQIDREFYRKDGIWLWTKNVPLKKLKKWNKKRKKNKEKAEAKKKGLLRDSGTETIGGGGEISKRGSTTKGWKKKKKKKKYKTGTNAGGIRGGFSGGGLGDSVGGGGGGTTTSMDSSLGGYDGGGGGGWGSGTTASVGGGGGGEWWGSITTVSDLGGGGGFDGGGGGGGWGGGTISSDIYDVEKESYSEDEGDSDD